MTSGKEQRALCDNELCRQKAEEPNDVMIDHEAIA